MGDGQEDRSDGGWLMAHEIVSLVSFDKSIFGDYAESEIEKRKVFDNTKAYKALLSYGY